MKRIINASVSSVFCAILLSGALASCGSSDNGDKAQEAYPDSLMNRSLTITSGKITKAVTRTTMSESNDSLGDVWSKGDKIYVLNTTQLTSGQDSTTLYAEQGGTNVTFSGGSLKCKRNDQLAMFYPYSNGVTVGQPGQGITLTITGQKGNLSDLATKYDFTFGRATVNSCTRGSATAATTSVSNIMAMARLRFVKDDSITAITTQGITTLVVDVVEGDFYPKCRIDLPNANLIFDKSSKVTQLTFNNTNTSGNANPNDFYLALFVESQTSGSNYKLNFTATTQEGETYKYTMDKAATFSANRYIRSTLPCTKL